MSLESKIEALTAAVAALTAQMQVATHTPVTTAAVPVVSVASEHTPTFSPSANPAPVTPPTFSAPVPTAATPLANGMPGGPSFAPVPTAATPVAPQPTPPSAPFSDLNGCTNYAMEAYNALEAKAPGTQRGEVVTQIIKHLCNNPAANINDLPVEKYGDFYTMVEQQKAA